MGHSHGIRWTNELIEKEIKKVMVAAGVNTMPTQSITSEIIGNQSLNNAISRSGGFIFWANRLGIEHLGIETVTGREFEKVCEESIVGKFDYSVEQMNAKYPYDLLVNDNIKIDVKVSKMYSSSFSMYTFNLEKRFPTCDIFVAYCISDNKKIIKTYVIPSKIMSGKTQLSMGVKTSKYDKYIDRWDLISKYNDFYDTLL